jgi:hypothetical protein
MDLRNGKVLGINHWECLHNTRQCDARTAARREEVLRTVAPDHDGAQQRGQFLDPWLPQFVAQSRAGLTWNEHIGHI